MFHGSLVAMVTPMLESGAVDYQALERLTAWHIDNKTDGIVILGTTGEAPTIELAERERIISQVVSQVNERIYVIVGAGANATQHTIALTRQAMEQGADAALLVTPYYNRPTQEGLYCHYEAVANAVPLPQILYNVPARTGCDLLPETVKRLDRFANIVALKEATPGVERLHALLDMDCGVDLLSGDDPSAMEFILSGGKGVISVTANVAPQWVHNMVQSALAGNRDEAKQWNNKLSILYEKLFVESSPIPVKWLLAKMGLIQFGIRLPLTQLSQQYHLALTECIERANLKVN